LLDQITEQLKAKNLHLNMAKKPLMQRAEMNFFRILLNLETKRYSMSLVKDVLLVRKT